MILFSCTIENFPVIPYVRMTQRGKFSDPRAKAYLQNQDTLAWEFKVAMQRQGVKTITGHCLISWAVHLKHKRGVDSDNAGKALQDALQKAGVVENDRLIRGQINTMLFQGEKNHVFVELLSIDLGRTK